MSEGRDETPASRERTLRLGVVGAGARGSAYARALARGEVPGARLAGVADTNPKALAPFQTSCATFAAAKSLIDSAELDALVVATPHAEHDEPALAALGKGLSLLLEKPLSNQLEKAHALVAEHARVARPGQLFATALVLRSDPRYVELKTLLERGELGAPTRASFVVSDCLRSASYYEAAPWRGRFAEAGGGILFNQVLHQLDLWQWCFGMPRRVQAFAGFGRHHAVQVEDEVTAYLEHERMTGVFVASSGEAPGTHRLEIAGELGKLVIDGHQLERWKNPKPVSELLRSLGPDERSAPATHERREVRRGGVSPAGLLTNFVRAIAGEEALLAPAAEGLPALELASALVCSALLRAPVELPLEPAALTRALAEPKKTRGR